MLLQAASNAHHQASLRRLLQDDAPLDISGSIVATGEPSDTAAAAAGAAAAATTPAAATYAPDAPDASVGEPVLEVTASAADVAAASAAAGTGRRRRNVIVAVPGEGYGAAQAVTPGEQLCTWAGSWM